jgi:hypothetical protein
MSVRKEMVREVADYLQEHFPHAKIGSAEDALTRNEVFTLIEAGTTRHVEVSERWLDEDEDMIPLGDAIRAWGLAAEIKKLVPNGILRMATTGLQRVS